MARAVRNSIGPANCLVGAPFGSAEPGKLTINTGGDSKGGALIASGSIIGMGGREQLCKLPCVFMISRLIAQPLGQQVRLRAKRPCGKEFFPECTNKVEQVDLPIVRNCNLLSVRRPRKSPGTSGIRHI